MRIVLIALTALLGIALGGSAGWLGAEYAAKNSTHINASFSLAQDGWLFSDTVGSENASALERARVAIGGPLALASSEAVYFLALRDSDGDRLTSSCVYRVSVMPIETRWWSVTIYDSATNNYIENPIKRSSWSNKSLQSDPETGQWAFVISGQPSAGAWLPAQPAAGQHFELLLRLYNPGETTRAALPEINLPKVEKLEC